MEDSGSFTCVILDKEKPFEEFKYSLILFEGPETHDLAIFEKNDGSFIKDILPKIKQVVPNIVAENF